MEQCENRKAVHSLESIHPLNRKRAEMLARHILENAEVKRIIIFGSSVTPQCHNESDVDIYVEIGRPTEGKGRLIRKYFDFPIDLWTDSMVDERLKKEIEETGVEIYG